MTAHSADRLQSSSTSSPETAAARVDVLGVGVSAVDIPLAVARLDRWVRTSADRYVCVTGVHGVMESQDDPELLSIHNQAGMVTPDGMPLVWLGRWGGQRQMDRVYGPDLMLEVCRQSPEKGWRHYSNGWPKVRPGSIWCACLVMVTMCLPIRNTISALPELALKCFALRATKR